MWVPEARLHAAGAGKWAGWSQAALKALPASETLGTTRTLPLPLRCQQTLWRGWRPLGSRGRRGPPGQQDSQRGWRWVVVGARKRSPLGGERGGTGCDVALAPCLGWGLSSFPLLRPAAALRPRTRPVPAAPTSPWVPADVFSNSWGGGPPYTQQGRGHGGREKRLPRAARTLGARAGSDPVSCSAPPWALNLRCPRFWTPPPHRPTEARPADLGSATQPRPSLRPLLGTGGQTWPALGTWAPLAHAAGGGCQLCAGPCVTLTWAVGSKCREQPPPTRSTPSLLRLPCCTVTRAVGGGCVLFAPVFLMGRQRLGSGPLVPTH